MSGYGQEIKLVVTDRHSIVMDRHQKIIIYSLSCCLTICFSPEHKWL